MDEQQANIERQQAEIRGMQLENRRIIDILLNQSRPEENPPE